ncbi:hypothetical protein PR048_011780 [Dryococelus australis]|uniref:Uncharacterized protein n=1 Tax=Dryococelus australis TaxID=614101 RepID=A0ABQ9HMM8_9NEOP|nr:hypothetical protein PR048_011780 [Dryococelus australis]
MFGRWPKCTYHLSHMMNHAVIQRKPRSCILLTLPGQMKNYLNASTVRCIPLIYVSKPNQIAFSEDLDQMIVICVHDVL